MSEASTIGIISDTHGLLRPEAIKMLQGVSYIIHAGDIGKRDIIPRLSEIAPVTAIRGNIDHADWAKDFAETASVELFGRRFFIIHDRNDLAFDTADQGYDVVISGHSHRPGTETVNGVLYLNPGSAGPRRFKLPITLATIRVAGSLLSATIDEIL
ncbi:metallophosphoesterase family protein [Fulvimarina sp. 2208YS6-2-32]|uniref:Phosphoesterase n=1 Tax=Fulvimarina uroteuthidis TaxID=3098149 RepID=A0ABU5I454_9HYPH|nr:metallophosphoesterase family protein [Fulvimarina sp. 2208YS6-2-32]MDY8110164.1 metallophosphoesterase family protein [Fulvimarina sp. 2208YS6-2-32]